MTQTWINAGSKSQSVSLSTNSDKTYLRIRIRSRDEEESENDSGKANQRDVKFKVRHIAKIGSEREDKTRPDYDPNNKPKNKSFVIKMKYPVGEFTKFKFLAQSLAERDSVLLAIKSLLDNGKQYAQQQQASHPRKSQPIEFEMRNDPVNVKSFQKLQISEGRDDVAEEDADSLAIPAPRNRIDTDEDEVFYDTRDEFTTHARAGDSEREDREPQIFGRSAELNEFQRANGVARPFDNSYYKNAPREDPPTTSKLRRADKWMEKKTTDSHRRPASRDITAPGKSRQHKPASRVIHDKQKARAQKILEHQRNRAVVDSESFSTRETADPMLSDCNSSQALSAIEDVDITNLAPDFTNPVVGPWCTDDICTASLKDFADSMTGIFDLKDNRNSIKGVYATNKVNRVKAEEYISGFLGDNTNMSELLSVKDLWNVAAAKHATGKELKRMRLHNRARKSGGQAKRLSNLRKKMTFSGGDERNASVLQTISSFDDVARKARNQDDDDLLYYDSDPEDARERTLRKGPREVMARREEASIRKTVRRRESLDILDTSRFGLGRRWKRLGQDVLSDIIEATKNEKICLLWHPTNDSNNNMSPVCVNVWVESGIYLTDGSFLLPKLTWLPAHEKNLENRELNVSDRSPGSLELLDVCRVKECQSIDRNLHPFANVERCFVIQTQNARYVFEAQSKQEKGRVVNGLKLVIARLASLLMLKDLRAVDEFFGGNAVPGEAPFWARGYEKSDSDDGFPGP